MVCRCEIKGVEKQALCVILLSFARTVSICGHQYLDDTDQPIDSGRAGGLKDPAKTRRCIVDLRLINGHCSRNLSGKQLR